MKYSSVADPEWGDAAHTFINCTVAFDIVGSVIFSANPLDSEPHGQEIYAACLAGTYGTIGAYVAPVATWQDYQNQAQAALDKVTGARGTVMRCLVAGVLLPTAWQTYIAALRAIMSASTGTPGTLPTPPANSDGSIDYPAGT